MNTEPNTPPVSLLELTKRQLHDWDELLAGLVADPNSPEEQIQYCMKQIIRLEFEIEDLTKNAA